VRLVLPIGGDSGGSGPLSTKVWSLNRWSNKKKGCGVSCAERYMPKPISQCSRFFAIYHSQKNMIYIVDRLRKILHSLTCTSCPNMNTWSNCRSEVKTNEMPSSNFCGCTSAFQKYAHVLNKPIGSCCLKYAGTRGSVLLLHLFSDHTLVCLTLRGWRHIQNLCGFSTPTGTIIYNIPV
jgi:hypothetical protein